jgi:NAD(P)-dependent dehydrogenase (short-subunit alcohol dehydrogenase family)
MAAKTLLITGASSGIGEAIALAYAARGDDVALAARDEAALRRVAERCERAGGRALVVPTDVTDPEQCRVMVDKTVERFGKLDVAIANAGISMWARFDEVTDLSVFERIMRVNYLGTVYTAHFALPHLKRSKGLLVGVSSLTGKTGVPTRSGYAASKHAMHGLLDSVRIEVADDGVDVLLLCPGFVRTDIRAKVLGPDGKPRGQSPRDETGKDTMSLEECTRICVRAIDRREREVVMTTKAKVGMWLKLAFPGAVDRIARRAIEQR